MLNDDYNFQWKDIGDIMEGRPNLGNQTHVAAYRLMQYTMRSVLNKRLGGKMAEELFFEAGKLAGEEFCKNILDTALDFYPFIAQLQQKLQELNIGILRIEETNLETMKFIFVLAEDLDCSGLPLTNETVCDYDEGFISGLFKAYTQKDFDVKEIDCWSSGERVCRFKISLKDE
ncbi:MAG: V4R domain-containing protein [Bacteroidota bacterium]|nr:V4R domain-containing protein [Bacteroidota bacterium]